MPSDRSDLAVFVAVAAAGSLRRAAERLGRTQPALTARLAGLERTWDTRLFRREARGMALTPEGARLLPLAEAALDGLASLDRAAGVSGSEARALRVGAGDALGRERLPRALHRLVAESPGLEVRVREGTGTALLAALRDGEIDVALVVRPDAGRAPTGVEITPCLRSSIVLLVPPGSGGAGRRAGPARLANERLVALQRGSGFRRHLEAAFRAAGRRFHAAVEVGNLSLVRRFVAAGLGVAPVPAIAFPAGRIPGVERREVGGIPPVFYDRAIRAGAPLRPEAGRLLELLGDDDVR